MRTFDDYAYVRPDLEALAARSRELLDAFGAAGSAKAQSEVIRAFSALRDGIETALSLVEIRHTRDTEDAFYEAENDFMDEADPVFEGLKSDFYAALTGSRFRAELELEWGSQLFRLAELQMRTFRPEVMEDLRTENRLASEYVKLKASARLSFEGAERNLSEMQAFAESPDRDTRRRATEAVSGFYAEHEAEFDRIFDGLVATRTLIARKLGFPDFTGLGYARLGRSDYGAAEVAGYRAQVLGSVVTLAERLRSRQARRLGLESLKYHDEALEFADGNPEPLGGAAAIVERGLAMFADMSAETAEFFRFMAERRLLDLETRKGKAAGGYCTFLPDEGSPYVFANFNGTADDIDTFTHEAGHAFQVYRSRGFVLPEYRFPTYEACEIHSMGMEFLAWPWMDGFFGGDADKYRFHHLEAGILFIPYGAAVDEFQHWVYANPGSGPAARKAAWREVERRYLPWRDYGEDAFLERGGFWLRQGHIFEDPFYYIDYTLAQVCAYELWAAAEADRPAAWRRYLALCDRGGSLSFLGLLAGAGLRNPFAAGSVAAIMAPAGAWLDGVDDRRLKARERPPAS